MTEESTTPGTARSTTEPLLVEDLLLLLFKPDSGTIAGENTLFYVLGGAVLAQLAQIGAVEVEKTALGARVRSVGEPPADDILRTAWDYSADKARGVQGMLAAIGPHLRKPILERLVTRGDIDSESRRLLGLIPTTALSDGGTGRRAELLARVRAVLVDGVDPDEKTGALAALISASGALPTFHKEIPWTSAVIERATALQKGEWGADAAASAVTRTMTAIVVNSMVAAGVVSTVTR